MTRLAICGNARKKIAGLSCADWTGNENPFKGLKSLKRDCVECLTCPGYNFSNKETSQKIPYLQGENV